MRGHIAATVLVLAPAAVLAAPRIDSVSVKVLAGKGNDVVISVSIERPTLLDLNCDAFIDPGDGYLELNVAPSGKWASYEFVAYREGMSPAERVVLNTLEYAFGDEHGELRVSFVGLPPIDAWRLGVAAVIEDIDGRKSYWALAHPADKPDFHHHDAFALTVSADNA